MVTKFHEGWEEAFDFAIRFECSEMILLVWHIPNRCHLEVFVEVFILSFVKARVVRQHSRVSLSTARGYMAATFKGTILHNAFLPIIDPKTFTPASAGQ